MLLCDGCDRGYHTFCLNPPLARAPLASWFCPDCLIEQVCGGGQRGGLTLGSRVQGWGHGRRQGQLRC